jgi:uncharacterized membrane protein YcaP (DUF421 family)
MEFVLRALFIYVFLMIVFSISGKRSMAQIDTFDFVLLLIISEATQQALIGPSYSLTTAAIVIVTLVGAEVAMACLKDRFPVIEKYTSGGPLLLIENGRQIKDRMKKEKIGVEEILAAARRIGVERLEQIKFAILESGGDISVIPFDKTSSLHPASSET